MLKFGLDLFFPPVCCVCGELNSNWICDNCKRSLYINKKSIILDIYSKKYDKLAYLFLYEDIRNLILEYKFNNKSYIKNLFSHIITEDEKICRNLNLYDIIIPVPMSKKKRKKRGYNQTELIAKDVASSLNIEYCTCLIKNKNNKTQSLLNEKQRFENVKNVFEITNCEKINGKNIILIDDIITTGATIEECSKVLKRAGAKSIFVLALAKD